MRYRPIWDGLGVSVLIADAPFYVATVRSVSAPVLSLDGSGLACPAGGFHFDPYRPVERAVITHAHGDHARPGSTAYLAAEASVPMLRRRLPEGASIEGVAWGVPVRVGDARVSFHPAGHVLGSAQVRIEVDGEVWVVSGDYKRREDPTCEPFEVVPCHGFVTEATFALPVYRWPSPELVVEEILEWWDRNRAAGRASLLFCYALGKAQRILGELARRTERGVLLHGALAGMVEAYRESGIEMLPTALVSDREPGSFAGELVLAPPSARRSPWMRRFRAAQTAFASGWMQVRGTRRGRGVDRGFVLSDHADWDALLRTIEETGAETVWTTHGFREPLARFLREERGLDARSLETAPRGDEDES